MYEHVDQSWVARPKFISEETIRQLGRRLADYAAARRLDALSVILHGGEPLLVGPERMGALCRELRSAMPPGTSLDLRVHTNGTQLGERYLELFRELGVSVGISLDGDRAANDRHRLDRRGRSSYDRVVRALQRLRRPEYRHLDLGLLCTVDVENEAVTVHDALTALEPPQIDYLLPHATWDAPPPGLAARAARGPGTPGPGAGPADAKDATPYADWLLAAFDRWTEQGRTTRVRTFDSVLSTLRGGPSLTEALGLAPADLVVVETDGSYEQVDSLKVAYAGAPETGMDVFRHSLDQVAGHPGVLARQRGLAGLSETCRGCAVVESCGGGLYSHRFSTERGFDNPSVYCADLWAFVQGVAERVTRRELEPAVEQRHELWLRQAETNRELTGLLHQRFQGRPGVEGHWSVLLHLERHPEPAAALDAVLAHPYVRAALLAALAPGALVDPDVLAPLAAAAAVRAGAEATIVWEQAGRQVHLPSLGTLDLPAPGRLELRSGPGGFVALTDDGTKVRVGREDREPAERWRPLTAIDTAAGPVLLDDADPGRSCLGADVVGPLAAESLRLLAKRWTLAWAELDERLPGWTDASSLLPPTVLTPLAPDDEDLRASTAPHEAQEPRDARAVAQAVGAIGLPLEADGTETARLLLRAARRSRLAALRSVTDLHLVGGVAGRLFDSASDSLADAAFWRDDDKAAHARARDAAALALRRLGELPDGQLTRTGEVLLGQLCAEAAREAAGAER